MKWHTMNIFWFYKFLSAKYQEEFLYSHSTTHIIKRYTSFIQVIHDIPMGAVCSSFWHKQQLQELRVLEKAGEI